MRKSQNIIALGLLAAAAFASCTEDTGTLGIIPTEDVVSTSKATFWGSTRSTAMGPIVANNSNAYLGNVLHPETGTLISASYAAQFHCFENYSLPKKENMVGDIVIDPASGDTTSPALSKHRVTGKFCKQTSCKRLS